MWIERITKDAWLKKMWPGEALPKPTLEEMFILSKYAWPFSRNIHGVKCVHIFAVQLIEHFVPHIRTYLKQENGGTSDHYFFFAPDVQAELDDFIQAQLNAERRIAAAFAAERAAPLDPARAPVA